MSLSDGYDQDLWLENAYWLGQYVSDTSFNELIGEVGLFHIMWSQEYVWMASSACMPFLSIRDRKIE